MMHCALPRPFLPGRSPRTMSYAYTTQDTPQSRACGTWREVITSVYFDVELEVPQPESFSGGVQCWSFGSLVLSRVESTPVRYRRLRHQCDGKETQLLVSVPLKNTIEFEQLGRRARSGPGQFLVEYSDAPYEFCYGQASDMWVLKLPEAMLRSRVGNASRFCALQFDAVDGIGKLFRDYVGLMARHTCNEDPDCRALMGAQLTDLLAAALLADPRVVQSSMSAVKNAHVARVEHYVRRNLTDASMSPEKVALACHISERYLYALFKESGRTFSNWVRELRLQAAFEVLQRGAAGVSVARTAYELGFSDHAQFSNAFRKHFGRAPSDVLNESRLGLHKS